jgi:hypothetical protein
MNIIDKTGKSVREYEWSCLDEQGHFYTIDYVLKDILPEKKALIINPLDLQSISKHKVDIVLINASADWWEDIDTSYIDVPCYILSSNWDYFYNRYKNYLFFPFWLISSRFFLNKIIMIKNNIWHHVLIEILEIKRTEFIT